MKSLSRTALVLFAGLVALAACQRPATAEGLTLETEEHKILYAIGLAISQQLAPLGLEEAEIQFLQAGLADALTSRTPQVDIQEYGPKIQGFAQQRISAASTAESEAGQALLASEAAKEGAITTDSGLVYFEVAAGEGDGPGATDTVSAHYKGTLRDGKVFDSSYDRGEPASFALNQVVPCWTEALQRMKPGGKARFLCPAEIAYGAEGRPGIPGGSTLIFEVELIGIEEAASPTASEDSEG